MGVHVKSEIGTLKRVMLHRPGRELEQLVPGELERLLFDDIPYLKTARPVCGAFEKKSYRGFVSGRLDGGDIKAK